MVPLSRKDFYDLASRCHEEALTLARYDQSRVNLEQCRRFNQWLATIKEYDQLAPYLGNLSAARPINRWMVIAAVGLLWMTVALVWGRQLGGTGLQLWTLGATGSAIIIYFLPEALYGTTIEMLEGKVLRVVEASEHLLFSRSMELSEAAFFKVKENLQSARRELRQQIHLAHQA